MTRSRAEITLGDNDHGFQLGQNFGHIHVAPDRPETPPAPSSNVPYHRDPHFVARPGLTDRIRTKLEVPEGRVALVGLGGVGKSQLAIEYARELRRRSPHTWVLWIHSSGAARFEQSVRNAADLLRIRGRRDPKADILQLFWDRLRDGRKGSWLIVLDNADDAGFLLEPPAVPDEACPMHRRIDCIPVCEHGSVVITTRSKSEALRLVYEADIIDVSPMSEGKAEALLEAKLGHPSPDYYLLVRALDCIPLAITQAAAYIRERGLRCSARQYREQVEQSRESRVSLLRRPVPLPGQDAEASDKASNAVMLTWQISFDHIYRTQRSAAELLSLMSFCDRLAIPESLLRVSGADAVSPARSCTFEDDIVLLRNFSFVSETADPSTWEMHRLVQDATQIWLGDHGRCGNVLNKFVKHLFMSFPVPWFENWSLCRTLFPHVVNAIEYRPVSQSARIEWASVMYDAAWFALEQGAYDRALRMAECSQTVRSEQLGEDNEVTLSSTAIIASTYRRQGQLKEAEELDVKVKEANSTRLGREHPNTLIAIGNLASTYQHQGRWKKAEELGVKVVKARSRRLGEEHLDTLRAIVNLASTYRHQGRWKEAEKMQVKVIEARSRRLGEEHPDTLTATCNLASTYRYQGRWKEAEELGVKVVEAMSRRLGEKHPNTLIAINNLALTYRHQGRWKEAEKMQVKVMEARSRRLGEEHPYTLTSMNDLAVTYCCQERWLAAEELQVRVVDGCNQSYGPQHPHTWTAVSTLENIRRHRGEDSASAPPRDSSSDSNVQTLRQSSDGSDEVNGHIGHKPRWQWLRKLRGKQHR